MLKNRTVQKTSFILITIILITVITNSPVLALSKEDPVRLTVGKLISSYESRQVERVLELLSSGFSNPVGMERSLRDEYSRYHSIEVLVRIGPILVQKDSASAKVKWYKKRIDLSTGTQEIAEGEVTLYFHLERGEYKLIRQEGRGFLPEPSTHK